VMGEIKGELRRQFPFKSSIIWQAVLCERGQQRPFCYLVETKRLKQQYIHHLPICT
jgi:hypothetical protein